jgi:hypothetical protein
MLISDYCHPLDFKCFLIRENTEETEVERQLLFGGIFAGIIIVRLLVIFTYNICASHGGRLSLDRLDSCPLGYQKSVPTIAVVAHPGAMP